MSATLVNFTTKGIEPMSEEKIIIGSASASSGERTHALLQVARLCDGSPVEVPVIVVNGESPGKCIWIQSGVHGNEYVGSMAIHNILSELESSQISGSLIMVPMTNVLAFRAATRSAEQDGLDMNRVWPGNDFSNAKNLSAHTEIVVHHLFQAMRRYADVVIDCHSGGWANKMANWIAYLDSEDEASEICSQLADAAGFDVIWRRQRDSFIRKVKGSVSDTLALQGVPCIVVESGGEGRVDSEPLLATTNALKNMLKAAGVLAGEPDITKRPKYVVRGNWLRAKEGGMFCRAAELLQAVSEGDLIGTVTDLHGDTIEEITSSADGIVIGIRTLAIVNSGEYVGNVAEPA